MSNTIGVDDLLAQMRAMSLQAKGLQNTIASPDISRVGGEAGNDSQNSFATVLKDSVNKVNETQTQANKLAEAFQKGDPNVQVSEVMLALQKSDVSFQAMVQVRNKLLQAYQEIMNMPV